MVIEQPKIKARLVATITSQPGALERTDNSMFSLTCPECKAEFSNKEERIAKRVLAIHRTKEHQVQSEFARRTERARNNKLKALTANKKPQNTLQASSWWRVDSHEIPISLPECPVCHTKFVAIQPQQQTEKKG